jgi:hypothetical protein
MPFLENMGIAPSFTTLTGTVEQTFDGIHPARLTTSSGIMSTQLLMSADGNRLEGTVSNGFASSPSVLYRQ